MSTRALCLATRNLLRSSLTNFYTGQAAQINANCRVMMNHNPTPSAGEEFIAVYGSSHRPREEWLNTAIEEQFGITVAITRRVALIPMDHRGESGYIIDDDAFTVSWTSIEQRCREIVGLIDKNYVLMRAADALFDHENGFSEPLVWQGTDPAPTEVGAEHFCAWHGGIDNMGSNTIVPLPGQPDADAVYGILMHVRFDGAIRLSPRGEYDTALPE